MVHVVIKAANGAVDDFRVSGASLQWTVAELKNHLYRYYPTHPPIPSQKLIYSGQLLQNSQHLSDILTHTDEDTEQVVIHLVAYERSASAPCQTTLVQPTPLSPASGGGNREEEGREEEREEEREEGRRGERVNETDSSTTGGREPPSVVTPPPNHTPHPWLRYRPHAQHMQRFPGDPMFPMFPVGGGYPYPPLYAPPYAAVNQAHMQQWYNAYYARPGVIGGGMEGEEVGGEGDDIDLPNLPDQPDNPDVDQDDLPMNAGAGGMMLAGPQLQARRDLVDYGYMLLMATVLVSIAYFTSSFGRIILFLAGVLFMFMNQAGWFSLQRRPRNAVPDAGVDLPDPLARHQARQNQQRRGDGEEQEGGRPLEMEERERDLERVAGAESPDGATEPLPTQRDSTPPEPPEPPRPGVLTVVFTFVTTLFTSLVPQQQPDIQFQ